MADSGNSQQSEQSQLNPTVASTKPPRAARGKTKISLVHSNVVTLRDLLEEFSTAFPNIAHLDAYDIPSKYDQSKVDLISTLFGIVSPYRAVAASPFDRACNPKEGAICIFKETFYAGFRLPPPPFIFRLLAEVRVCPTQLYPNAWRFIYCYMVQCRKHNLEPSVSVFRYLFKFTNSPNNTGWVQISHRSLSRTCFIPGTSPDSLPNWKKEFFYLFMDGANWGDFFRLNFSKAVDGSMRDIKLGVDERAAIEILTTDGTNHCAQLISEGSLQAAKLSDLGEQGRHAFL